MAAADEQLMLAYREGDAHAFETLYRRHRGPLFRYVLRSVRDRHAAEELFQEIWMRVIDARERYAPTARFGTWLYTIAHNRLTDHWRKRGLTLVSLDDGDDSPPELAARPAHEPQRQAETREQLARLSAALEALPAVQREAFLLHEEAGMTVAEIAGVTGVGEDAAKSRLRYALAKLREVLDDD